MTCILNLHQLGIGFGLGYSAISIPALHEGQLFEASAAQLSLFASLISVGQIIGGLSSIPIASNRGRKFVVLMACIPSIIGWLLQGLGQSLATFLVGRLLVGYALGAEGSIHSGKYTKWLPQYNNSCSYNTRSMFYNGQLITGH